MQVKNKGRIHPSPPSHKNPNSVFKLFPAAILALASALPPHDQEVLAYIVSSTSVPFQSKHKHKKGNKIPHFQCGCFDCYTRFWHRWDSSPNRDLIHQVIEAFEDHLVQNESPKKHSCRKKDKAMLNIVESNEAFLMAESRGSVTVSDEVAAGDMEMEVVAAVAGGGVSHQKGLARKVVGLFNSRFWSLWGPDI
ncbi:hypothetical protein like AT1G62422 [Hibiscus trionum]|uniref:Uncharacterized protein n=1 Tax=Hibiscus trionum TaxID=183268 RepID=A0A9W7HFU8_HIBTR|nr:hypothetical protein like AT1G62422 [Hibiscus trionum]